VKKKQSLKQDPESKNYKGGDLFVLKLRTWVHQKNKTNHHKVNRKTTNWDMVSATHITDKERIYKIKRTPILS